MNTFFRSSQRRCSVKKGGLKLFCKFLRKTLVLESLFNKFASLQAYFEEHLRTTASFILSRPAANPYSVNLLKKESILDVLL